MCNEVSFPEHMREFDLKDGRFKYKTASCMWMGFSKAWQSRQSEFDAMTEALLNQTQLLAKQKVEVDEKDKRIESALAIVSRMAKATNSTAMWAYDLEKALRGEHE